jgi:predicted nucleic acid-binding protein
LHVARTHALSSYDASYLELALRRRVPLATLDGRLKDAAKTAGVPFYQPHPT